jgi:hypothetical protein
MAVERAQFEVFTAVDANGCRRGVFGLQSRRGYARGVSNCLYSPDSPATKCLMVLVSRLGLEPRTL